jgi:hypothetical protein
MIKYLPPESMIESTAGVVILMAIRDSVGLRLFVHRSYKQHISDRDQAYIDDLLMDLVLRSKTHPDEVFEQLSNLSVGPVITGGVGWIDLYESAIEEIYPDFLPCVE